MAQLLDQYGNPIDLSKLKQEQGAPTIRGVRQPYNNLHPSSGLNPRRLASILRESIDGDPARYLALAEDMEERDQHYAGVLGIRKRQVAGLTASVEAASDKPDDVANADLVRAFTDRETFQDELIDILDAIGKSYSGTEIVWDTSEGDWQVKELKFRLPEWFWFDRADGETLLLRDVAGYVPLNPYQWIAHKAKAKSGLPIRGGLARGVAWAYLFKSFTLKDWAVFCEAYGQPLRLGKYDASATEEDKEALLRAVSNIGSDFGAIVPNSMAIEFVQAAATGTIDLYERRADWLDRQTSKLVLGQVGTTDAVAGGYATASVHDGVRQDIETADARQLSATLNRDLVRPLVDLNRGPQKAYPRIRIGREDDVDVDALVKNVSMLVPLGLKVGMSTMRDKLGLPDPDPDEEILQPASSPAPDAFPPEPVPTPQPVPAPLRKAAASQQPVGEFDAIDEGVKAILADQGWEPLIAPIVAGLSDKLATASSLEDVRTILAGHLATMDTSALQETLAKAGFSARIAGLANETLDPTK